MTPLEGMMFHRHVFLITEKKQKQLSAEVVAQKPSENKLQYDKVDPDSVVLPILMMACNRADAVSRSLDLVLK